VKPPAPPTGNEQTVLARTGAGVDAPAPEAKGKRCDVCGTDYPADFVVCPKDATPLASAGSGDDPLIGTVLGGTFKIVGLIAAGGMGRLYDAEHLRLDRLYAIKVIHESYASISDLVLRFDREARAMSRIKSIHVVQVIDVLRAQDGRPCIVFEKLEGEDLEEHLEKVGRLRLRTALDLARQLCHGLAAAHAHNIVHRDLKPSNLFLTPSEDGGFLLKILDFGVAKMEQDANLTATGAVVGTPAYMAPEQARSSAGVDARSDVYAVGAVLYRMITGRAPYAATDVTATLASVLEKEPTRPTTIEKSIPIGMEALVQRAMARDPKARPQTVAQLDGELASFEATLPPETGEMMRKSAPSLSGAVTLSGVHSAVESTKRAKRARPLALALALPVLLGAGITVGAVLASVVLSLGDSALLTSTELVLVAVGGGIAALVAAAAYGRALARIWGAVPEVHKLVARVSRALLAGVAVYGVLELLARAWSVVESTPVGISPLGLAGRVALAGVVTLFFVLRKPA
jgi:serine/threonine-protein kinase